MIRPLFFALATTLLLQLPPVTRGAHAADAEVIDGIAAVVNGEVITMSQVRLITGPRERLLRSQYTGEELQKQLKEVRTAALKDLIDRQLIVQAFREEKFSLPDYFLEQRINDIIRENFGGDRNTFMK